MKEGGDKPASMSLQPALPNAPTENDLIASKCCGEKGVIENEYLHRARNSFDWTTLKNTLLVSMKM